MGNIAIYGGVRKGAAKAGVLGIPLGDEIQRRPEAHSRSGGRSVIWTMWAIRNAAGSGSGFRCAGDDDILRASTPGPRPLGKRLKFPRPVGSAWRTRTRSAHPGSASRPGSCTCLCPMAFRSPPQGQQLFYSGLANGRQSIQSVQVGRVCMFEAHARPGAPPEGDQRRCSA